MRRCSAFLRRSMARSCWPRYPAYLISVSIDLSSLRISDERLTAEHAERADELRSKNRGVRSRRAGASCSTVNLGPLQQLRQGMSHGRRKIAWRGHSCPRTVGSSEMSELDFLRHCSCQLVLSSTCFTSSRRCFLASKIGPRHVRNQPHPPPVRGSAADRRCQSEDAAGTPPAK